MAHNQLLHELLKEDQEPFHLKSYISDRKSQMKKLPSPATTLQLRKQKSTAAVKRSSNLAKHACFLSFKNSPDVRKSPLFEFPSPLKSPCKSPNNAAVFLHIPSRTAALLVEAAMRVQKQPKSQTKNAGFGLFSTFLKRLRERSKSKKRVLKNAISVEGTVEDAVRMSCSCSNRRLSSSDWTENNEDKSFDFDASTSSCSENGDFGYTGTRFCTSPFLFSLHRSSSSSGRRTPEFCSSAASPSRHVKQDKEKYELSRNSSEVEGEEEEKEQCSPVSVLDPPFEDENGDVNEDDYDLECTYQNVQRAKQQLLFRLRRFEKLAELDPIELERKLLEGSDDEGQEESDDEEPLSSYSKLVSDLIVEERTEMIMNSGANDVVMGRISKRLDSWKEVEFNTIDMMVGSDLKRETERWTEFTEHVEETAAEIELAILVVLIEELSEEMEMVSC